MGLYFGTLCPEVLKAGDILVVPPGQRYNSHIEVDHQQKQGGIKLCGSF